MRERPNRPTGSRTHARTHALHATVGTARGEAERSEKPTREDTGEELDTKRGGVVRCGDAKDETGTYADGARATLALLPIMSS